MSTLPKDAFVQKDIANAWQVTVRTVRRRLRRYGVKPCGVTGIQPLYRQADIDRVFAKHNADMLKRIAAM